MPPILLGVGPVTIGVICPQPGTGHSATADAALESLDDPVALLGDRVVGVDDLLATVFADVLGPACAAVTVVHPTWWPRRRVERVRAAAAVTAATVTAAPRSELLRRHCGGDPVVVEIATDRVAVCRRGPVRLLGRRDHAGIAALVAHRASGTPVLIDVPDSVPGAAHTAAEVRKALADSGIDARTVDIYPPPDTPTAASAARRRPWITAAALTVTVVTVTLAVAMWPRTTDAPGPEAVALVEGRVSVEIPPDWAVRRVTGGPGSRRVEVTSPADDRSVLHITSAYTPEGTLAEAAAVLERVAAAEPAVFGDFEAAAEIAGRPALTYREVRPGRVVSWAVVLDGAMRIGIGCQSAPGREQSLGSVCAAAIASARDIGARDTGGTAPAPGASN